MSSPLIKIKSIAHNKIAAVQPAKLQVDVHLLIGSLHQHHSIHSLGLHLSEQLDQLLQGVTGIMDVLNNQDVLILKLLGLQLGLKDQLAGRLRPRVTPAPDELMSVGMLDLLTKSEKNMKAPLSTQTTTSSNSPSFCRIEE